MEYIQILQDIFPDNEKELSFDYNADFDQKFESGMTRLQDAIILLKKTRATNDKFATQAALVYIRV